MDNFLHQVGKGGRVAEDEPLGMGMNPVGTCAWSGVWTRCRQEARGCESAASQGPTEEFGPCGEPGMGWRVSDLGAEVGRPRTALRFGVASLEEEGNRSVRPARQDQGAQEKGAPQVDRREEQEGGVGARPHGGVRTAFCLVSAQHVFADLTSNSEPHHSRLRIASKNLRSSFCF